MSPDQSCNTQVVHLIRSNSDTHLWESPRGGKPLKKMSEQVPYVSKSLMRLHLLIHQQSRWRNTVSASWLPDSDGLDLSSDYGVLCLPSLFSKLLQANSGNTECGVDTYRLQTPKLLTLGYKDSFVYAFPLRHWVGLHIHKLRRNQKAEFHVWLRHSPVRSAHHFPGPHCILWDRRDGSDNLRTPFNLKLMNCPVFSKQTNTGSSYRIESLCATRNDFSTPLQTSLRSHKLDKSGWVPTGLTV